MALAPVKEDWDYTLHLRVKDATRDEFDAVRSAIREAVTKTWEIRVYGDSSQRAYDKDKK